MQSVVEGHLRCYNSCRDLSPSAQDHAINTCSDCPLQLKHENVLQELVNKDACDNADICLYTCRAPGNKDVLQPFADEESVKAAGNRLFQDVEVAQAQAVIAVACAINPYAAPAMTEGTL